jgi:hypothetical protein
MHSVIPLDGHCSAFRDERARINIRMPAFIANQRGLPTDNARLSLSMFRAGTFHPASSSKQARTLCVNEMPQHGCARWAVDRLCHSCASVMSERTSITTR